MVAKEIRDRVGWLALRHPGVDTHEKAGDASRGLHNSGVNILGTAEGPRRRR